MKKEKKLLNKNRGREKLLSKMLVTLLVTAMLMSIMPMPRAHAEDPIFEEIRGDISLNGATRENLKVVDSATITLNGVNTVKSTNVAYPGIWVPEGSTLTIKGNGTLNLEGCPGTGNYGILLFSPDIGGHDSIKGEDDAYSDAGGCGNIIIEGNGENEKCTINALNGIGGGRGRSGQGAKGGNCGDISITNAILNTEHTDGDVGSIGGGISYNSNGFYGTNNGGNCGNIEIINCVIESVCDIGGGRSTEGGGSCGNITITKSIIKDSQYIGGGCSWNGGESWGGSCGKINIKDSNINACRIGAGFGQTRTSGTYGEITISGGSLILDFDDYEFLRDFSIGGKTGGPITIKDDAIVYSAKQIGSTYPEEGDENTLNVNGKKTVILGRFATEEFYGKTRIKYQLFPEDGNLQADEGINRIEIDHDDPDSESQFKKVLRRFDTSANPFVSEANRGIWGAIPLPIGKAYFGGENGTELFMHGEFIELGISNWGDLGTLGTKPPVFRGTNNGWYGSSSIGMSADHDGFKKGKDLPIDYYLPGTPEERFAVGYKDASGSAFTNSNSAQMGDMNMETKVYNLSRPFDGILMAKIVSTWKGKMEITQIISFKESDKFYRNQVTLKNLSGETMENVRYMRSFDPDNTAFQGGDYSTENEILFQEADGSGDAGKYAVVRAQTYDENDPLKSELKDTTAPIFFFSKDANTRVANFGFVNSNPYAPPAYDAPQAKGYSTTSDSAISITHEFENLSANATSSKFVYYTSLDERLYKDVIPYIKDDPEPPIPTATGVDHDVTFQDYGGNTIETKAMPGGLPVSYIQAPELAGKVFEEWELVVGDETDLSALSQDITLKAIYADADYTVTFDSNGGNFAPKDKPPVDKVFAYVLKDEPVNEPSPPTKVDSVFKGWTTVKDGNTFWGFEAPIEGDMTLYANWASPVTVTFDGNASGDKANVPDAISVPSGESISLPSASRDGYEFKGWAETSDGTVFSEDEYTASSSKTLYAIWEAADFTGTVAIYKNTEEGFRALTTVRPEYSNELKAVVAGANNIADLKYQWYRADDVDSEGSAIDGAVSETYKVAEEDIDQYLRVAVSVEGQNGEIKAKTSQVKNKDASGKDYTLGVPWGFARDYNFDLSELLPDVDTPSELGNITYSIVSVSDGSGIFSTTPLTGDLSDSNITLSVNKMLETDINDKATIIIGYKSDSPLYNIANSTLTVKVVDKIAIDITAEMPDRVYDASPHTYDGTPEMTIKSTSQGITDELAYTVEYKEAGADDSTKTETAPTNVGTYELIISVDDKGYKGSTSIEFEITKAEMTITVQDKQIYVGKDIPPIDAPVKGEDFEVAGLCGEDTYSSSTGNNLVLKYYDEDGLEATPDKDSTGRYSIVGSGVSSDNYNITYVDGKLSIRALPVKDDGIDVIVDGKKETIGKETSETDGNGNKKTTIVVDKEQLDEKVKNANKGSEVKVIMGDSDGSTIKSAKFVVENIEKMAKNAMSLIVETPDINYVMRASAVDTKEIQKVIGEQIPTSEIPFNVTISKPTNEEKQDAIDNANEKGLEVLGDPVEFTVTANYDNRSFVVDRFKLYVARMIELTPEQAGRITTAVVHEEDGSVRHVPTEVTMKDGKYYAKVNSLTNSVYTLVYNEQSFSDTKGTWYDDIATEMASRKIIDGRSEDVFDGNANITRAEFAKMIVNALGLPANGECRFTDVPADAWYSGYVGMAYEYDLVNGRGDEIFDPMKNITRQEAMAIIERASRIAEFYGIDGIAKGFDDLDEVSSWAKDALDFNVANGMIVGYNGKLRPKDPITRAESAAVIMRLLRNANLIDNDNK